MKVKRDFNERFQGMKSYKKGDEYTFDNKERVDYLVENGYLEGPKKETKKKSGE
ncbi:hypothetical protein MKY34_11270 [Sporosarcina sp. FSL K6-1522]|uniref:hypothetical protein n=1 Tax=Sporosarcina sp. FSL K6-1522 TaxID=2921554 RepID=UPI003159E65D